MPTRQELTKQLLAEICSGADEHGEEVGLDFDSACTDLVLGRLELEIDRLIREVLTSMLDDEYVFNMPA